MTYIQLAENITREDRFMQVKHKTTQALLMRYLAGDKSLYIEKEDINGENGATTIYLDGSPQIWSVHHKEYEEIAVAYTGRFEYNYEEFELDTIWESIGDDEEDDEAEVKEVKKTSTRKKVAKTEATDAQA